MPRQLAVFSPTRHRKKGISRPIMYREFEAAYGTAPIERELSTVGIDLL